MTCTAGRRYIDGGHTGRRPETDARNALKGARNGWLHEDSNCRGPSPVRRSKQAQSPAFECRCGGSTVFLFDDCTRKWSAVLNIFNTLAERGQLSVDERDLPRKVAYLKRPGGVKLRQYQHPLGWCAAMKDGERRGVEHWLDL